MPSTGESEIINNTSHFICSKRFHSDRGGRLQSDSMYRDAICHKVRINCLESKIQLFLLGEVTEDFPEEVTFALTLNV